MAVVDPQRLYRPWDHETTYVTGSCQKTLKCGHLCGGVQDEDLCLPCLQCDKRQEIMPTQKADDMCVICFTDTLASAPVIQTNCGHLFHFHCVKTQLQSRWSGPRISFGFTLCPICKKPLEHDKLTDVLKPIRELHTDVRRKALTRLEYEGLNKNKDISTPGGRFYGDPVGFAMSKYAYYLCFKCNTAYYGGEARCEELVDVADDFNPAELVCGSCSNTTKAQSCSKHGNDYLEYKCRYCCSIAVYYCFGTTHFCNTCHNNNVHVCGLPKDRLPKCPAGPNAVQMSGSRCPLNIVHPPTGDEFALGCGMCENAHTF